MTPRPQYRNTTQPRTLPRNPNSDDRTYHAATLAAALQRITTAWPQVIRMASDMTPGFAAGGSGPTGKGDHSDPTPDAALRPHTPDPSIEAAAWLGALEHLAQHIVNIDGRLGHLLPGTNPDPMPPNCRNQHTPPRPLYHDEGARNGRCAWCYSFWRLEKQDPTGDLVKANDTGKRITTAMVAQALVERPRKTKTKRHGKKQRA